MKVNACVLKFCLVPPPSFKQSLPSISGQSSSISLKRLDSIGHSGHRNIRALVGGLEIFMMTMLGHPLLFLPYSVLSVIHMVAQNSSF